MLEIKYRGLLMFGVFLVGCSSEPDRLAVTGSVQLDGKPIQNCTLVFQQLNADGSPVSMTAALTDGSFAIPKSDGLVAGTYGVIFTEIQPDLEDYEAARKSGAKHALNIKFIPSKYTQPNDLRVQVALGMQPIAIDLRSK
jgi:hypothetical protein